MGRYNENPRVLTDGQGAGETEIDKYNNLKVTLATQIAGEDLINKVLKVEQRFVYTRPTPATAATTTVIKTTAGFLKKIIIGSKSAGTGKVTIYDNSAASGTVISVLDTDTIIGAVEFDCTFSTALTIATTLTTTAADITVIYR